MAYLPSQGSVAAWLQSGNASVITVGQGSIATVIIGGSILTSSTANQSVSGTVGASIIGTVPITGLPLTQNVSGSVVSFLTSTNASVITVGTAAANQSVSGTVGASVIGLTPVAVTNTPSISGTVNIGNIITINPTSVSGTVGASVIGLTPVAVTNTPSVSGTINVGNTVTINPVSVSGSLNVIESGTWNVSITGIIPNVSASALGKAEDSTANDGDTGVAVWGVRNDTLASVTSADKDYTQFTVGPSGEVVTANAPLTKWVQGNASVFTGVIQPIIGAQGSSVFTYITGVQVANASANNTYLTFSDGAGTTLGYTVAPANGGSNIMLPNAWKTAANQAFRASVSGVASIFISTQGFLSKT